MFRKLERFNISIAVTAVSMTKNTDFEDKNILQLKRVEK